MIAARCACSSTYPRARRAPRAGKNSVHSSDGHPCLGSCWLEWLRAGFRRNEHLKGLFLFLTFLVYFRPSELHLLCSEDVVPPRRGVGRTWSVVISPLERERSTGTVFFHDSVILDTVKCQMLEPWLTWFVEGRTAGVLLLLREPACMVHGSRTRALPRIGPATSESTPIPAQAGRPCFDTLSNQRTLVEVHKRDDGLCRPSAAAKKHAACV